MSDQLDTRQCIFLNKQAKEMTHFIISSNLVVCLLFGFAYIEMNEWLKFLTTFQLCTASQLNHNIVCFIGLRPSRFYPVTKTKNLQVANYYGVHDITFLGSHSIRSVPELMRAGQLGGNAGLLNPIFVETDQHDFGL